MHGLDEPIGSYFLNISMNVFKKNGDYEDCCSFIHLNIKVFGNYFLFCQIIYRNKLYLYLFLWRSDKST